MKAFRLPILAALLGLAVSSRADIVDEYDFAGNLTDSSGNGYNLNPGGTFQYVTGHDGATNSAVQLITNNPANGTFFLGKGPNLDNQSSSVSFWIRDDVPGSETWVFGLGHQNGVGGDTGQDMHVAFGADFVRYSFFYNDLDTPFKMQVGQWYNITATFDYATMTMSDYINGMLINSMASPYPFTGQDNLQIGFQGITLDDFKFYNTALTGNQVAALAGVSNVPDGACTTALLGLSTLGLILVRRRRSLG